MMGENFVVFSEYLNFTNSDKLNVLQTFHDYKTFVETFKIFDMTIFSPYHYKFRSKMYVRNFWVANIF